MRVTCRGAPPAAGTTQSVAGSCEIAGRSASDIDYFDARRREVWLEPW